MNEAERIAKAHRATAAMQEFIEPMLDGLRNEYAERLVTVATTELSRDKRADKVTALSNALKIIDVLEGGMREIMRDGELAQSEKVRAAKIEQMTAPQRRLLNIAPF